MTDPGWLPFSAIPPAAHHLFRYSPEQRFRLYPTFQVWAPDCGCTTRDGSGYRLCEQHAAEYLGSLEPAS